MNAAARSAAFSRATLDFQVVADQLCPEIIGAARLLFKYRTRLSAVQTASEMDDLRVAMTELMSVFNRLNFAHAAMTIGETASRIKQAAET